MRHDFVCPASCHATDLPGKGGKEGKAPVMEVLDEEKPEPCIRQTEETILQSNTYAGEMRTYYTEGTEGIDLG